VQHSSVRYFFYETACGRVAWAQIAPAWILSSSPQPFSVLPINPASQPNSRFQGLRVPGCRALGPGKRTEHQPQTRRLKPNSDCCITYYVILFLSKYYLSAWHPSAQFEEHSSHPKYSLRGTSQHFMVLPPTLFRCAVRFALGYFADLCRTCVLLVVENMLKWNTFV